MTKQDIVSEIKRLSEEFGKPPGQKMFRSATGIQESAWLGKFWARWGDALREAGFKPNDWTQKASPEELLEGLAKACRHYGKFPTNAELELLRRLDRSIPSPAVLKNHFGSHDGAKQALRNFVFRDDGYGDVRHQLFSRFGRDPSDYRTAQVVVVQGQNRRIIARFSDWDETMKRRFLRELQAHPAVATVEPTADGVEVYSKAPARGGLETLRADIEQLTDKIQATPAEEIADLAADADTFRETPAITSTSWTGVVTGAQRVRAVQTILPSVAHAVDALIVELEQAGGNGGEPLEDRNEALKTLRQLHGILGEIIQLADRGQLESPYGLGLFGEAAGLSNRVVRAFESDPLRCSVIAITAAVATFAGGWAGGLAAGVGAVVALAKPLE